MDADRLREPSVVPRARGEDGLALLDDALGNAAREVLRGLLALAIARGVRDHRALVVDEHDQPALREDQLVGAISGESRSLRITFPAEYGNAKLAGQAAVFATKVTAIKRRELPALDDDFAKDLGDFENLDDVKRKLQESIEAQRRSASDRALERSLLDELVTRTSFEVPPTLVARQLESQAQQLEQQLRGRLPEGDLRMRLAQLREEGWDDAKRRVQEALLLESVANRATLAASEDEIHARLDEMAASQGFDAKLMHDLAKAQGWHAAIASEIVDRKALAHLIEHARIVEIEGEREVES